MTCRACRKITPRLKQWIAPSGDRFCSGWCMDAFSGKKIMIDPTDIEQRAMDHAGAQAGEYLDALGKTDLAKMSAEEWATLINVVCSGYVEHLQKEIGRIETDLRYLRGQIEPIPA